jgi:hypothetical protein
MKMDDERPDSPEEERQRARAAVAIYLLGVVTVAIGFVIEGCL